MPVTLMDWARAQESAFLAQRASLRRFQRVLCRLGIHRWHQPVHLHPILHRFNESSALLRDLPFQKLDGHEYTYEPRTEVRPEHVP